MNSLNYKDILSISLTLFSVIDILGSIPIVVSLLKKNGKIDAGKATLISGLLMIGFLFLGQSILVLFSLDVQSFASAGAIVIFLLALEMILGITLMKEDKIASGSSSVVPLAFPLIAGAGTLTTILSLKAVFSEVNILVGIVFNLIFVYFILRISSWLKQFIGPAGLSVIRRIFGVILLAIAVKIFKTNFIGT